MATLDTRLTEVVGRTGTVLEKALELRTVGELLRHYPRRLTERGQLTDLQDLMADEDVTVLAEVRSTALLRNRSGNGVRLEVVVGDGRSTLKLTFFAKHAGQVLWREKELTPGAAGFFAGRVTVFNRVRQLANPEYVLLGGEDDTDWAGALMPVYPASKEIRSWTILKAVRLVLDSLDDVPDPVPRPIRVQRGLPELGPALRGIHRPASWAEYGAARTRLAYDEALTVQLALALRRAAATADPARPRPGRPDGLLAAFDRRLPFTLTAGQREVGATVSAEIATAHPMHRLLQGEVGSGKTVVALRAMLQVVDSGGQAALLAPTEVLAAQHARTIDSMLGDLAQGGRLGGSETATRVALLTGSLSAGARRAALLDAAGGAAGIVVGTHALIQQHVQFADLGLVVVDEQHRFGVEQRDALRSKAASPPHLLVMTATPIPRTVAMTVFGDLDTSTLVELPAGRSPIRTSVVPVAEKPQWLDRAWARIREEVAAGRQAYVVCPRIGDGGAESDIDPDDTPPGDLDSDGGADERRAPLSVHAVHDHLAAGPLAGLRLGVLHGRLPTEDKDAVMRAFADGAVDVLVATTVVEVGVDVPNASVMVVMDADRFGISQLHQLRGRIGRGPAASVCLLVTEAYPGSTARVRLDAVASTTDGFALAELDVEQRSEGDILGTAQSGRKKRLKLLSLRRDVELIGLAREDAFAIVAEDPQLRAHPLLAEQVELLARGDQASYLEKA
jgi:ATP-dependent DNA helicase RecG